MEAAPIRQDEEIPRRKGRTVQIEARQRRREGRLQRIVSSRNQKNTPEAKNGETSPKQLIAPLERGWQKPKKAREKQSFLKHSSKRKIKRKKKGGEGKREKYWKGDHSVFEICTARCEGEGRDNLLAQGAIRGQGNGLKRLKRHLRREKKREAKQRP